MRLRMVIMLCWMTVLSSGCGMMAGSIEGRVDIQVPPGTIVYDEDGDVLPIKHDVVSDFVIPDHATDAIKFDFHGYKRTVELRKHFSGWTLLNILNFGFGFPFDEVAGVNLTYSPIQFSPDAAWHQLDSTNMEQPMEELPHVKRPKFLLTAATGWPPFKVTQNAISPAYLEAAIGLNYRSFDLLYRYRSETHAALTPDILNLRYDGTYAEHDVELRRYLFEGLFVGAGYARVRLSGGMGYGFLGSTYDPSSSGLHAITGSLGWAGDFSFVEGHYTYGLNEYQLYGFNPQPFRKIILSWGLFLRI